MSCSSGYFLVKLYRFTADCGAAWLQTRCAVWSSKRWDPFMRAEPWTTAARVGVFIGGSILSEVLCVTSRAFSGVFRKQSCHTIRRCAPACLFMLSHKSLTTVCTSVQPRSQILVFNQICLGPSQQAQRENQTGHVKRGLRHGAVTNELGEREVLRALYTQVVPQLRVLICCHHSPDATSEQQTVSTPRDSLSLFSTVRLGPGWACLALGLACST